MYPNLPQRHGHKFVPSWESEGQVGAEVLCHSMTSRIHSTKDPRLMAYTTHSFLLRWFPDRLLGVSDFKYMSRRSGWRDVPTVHPAFTRQDVLAVKHHYRGLVGVVVDKGPGRLLSAAQNSMKRIYTIQPFL